MTTDAAGPRDNSLTQQLLREIAERIRLRCGKETCADCRRDAEDLERIAAGTQACCC
jgi:hypothetical protein